MAMGGISAFYPSQVPFHYVSPYIPQGRDTFGEVLKEAHARGIRVVGRFDLSKTHKDAYDAHPEWFFKKANGEPAIYNGLYQACVNGGWYREKAIEILDRGAGALRRGRAVLQHVQQSVVGLQRQPARHLPVRQLPAPVPRALRPRPAAASPTPITRRSCTMPRVDDVGDHPPPDQDQAAAGGAGGDLARDHRHGVLRIEHRGAAAAAAVAVRLERQRQPRAQHLSAEDGDQPVHVVHRLPLALRHGAAGGDPHAAVAERRQRRRRGDQRPRHAASSRTAPRSKPRRPISRG